LEKPSVLHFHIYPAGRYRAAIAGQIGWFNDSSVAIGSATIAVGG